MKIERARGLKTDHLFYVALRKIRYSGLSATFGVGSTLARGGGEIDFTGITHQNIKKWEKAGGTNDMSWWRNCPVPPLADKPVGIILDTIQLLF